MVTIIHMGSQAAPLYLTLKGQMQGHSDFEGLYIMYISCKRTQLNHILLLNINRTSHMGSPMASSHFVIK